MLCLGLAQKQEERVWRRQNAPMRLEWENDRDDKGWPRLRLLLGARAQSTKGSAARWLCEKSRGVCVHDAFGLAYTADCVRYLRGLPHDPAHFHPWERQLARLLSSDEAAPICRTAYIRASRKAPELEECKDASAWARSFVELLREHQEKCAAGFGLDR